LSGLIGALLGLSAIFAARAIRESGHRAVAQLIPKNAASVKSALMWRALRGDGRAWSLLGFIVGFLIGGLVDGIVGAAIGAAAIVVTGRRRATSQSSAAQDQLADAARAIAAGMRAGLSVPQSLAYAVAESQPPLRDSLGSLVDSIQVGVSVDQALDSWALDVGSDDARLLSGVLRLHRRSGGQLPAVLDQVAATLRARRAAAMEVGALTAQARLSGAILGFLPIGFFAFLWLTSRDEIQGAFHNSTGVWSVSIGLLMDAAAFLWIRKLLKVT
jgi:tight adherence protein B